MQLKIKNISEKQKKQIKNNWKTETQQKTQKIKKKTIFMFFLFFPNVQQISQVIPSISAFCSQVPFFVYYLFISCILCFCPHICCLFAVYYLIIFCVEYLSSSCVYFVSFLFFWFVFYFQFFFWWVFICCFFNFFRNQHFSGHSESLKSDVIQHVGNIGRGKSLRSIFLGLSDRKI